MVATQKTISSHLVIRMIVAVTVILIASISITITLGNFSTIFTPFVGLIAMHPDTCVGFILGGIGMLMTNPMRRVMYFGMLMGFGYLFAIHEELPSIGTGVCMFSWGIGMIFNRRTQFGYLIMFICATAIIGYIIGLPTMSGSINDISTAMNPVTIMMFFIISLYMTKKPKPL